MKYRRLGPTDMDISAIAMGCMRNYFVDDPEQRIAIIHRALDLGINFFETGSKYSYPDRGLFSERTLGEALASRPEKPYIMSKVHVRTGPTVDAVLRQVESSLEQIGVNCIDIYGAWSVEGVANWEGLLAPGGTLDGLRAARDRGLCRYIGITTHDRPAIAMERIAPYDDFVSVTVPYNIAKRHFRPLIDWAQESGLGIFTMQSTGGGLFSLGRGRMDELFRDRAEHPALAAQRWLLAHSGITAPLIGFDAVEQVETSAALGDEVDDLEAAGEDAVDFLADYADLAENLCQRCGYCHPCPQGINIHGILLQYYQIWRFTGDVEYFRVGMSSTPSGPDSCVRCGLCEERCPSKLPVMDLMAQMAADAERLGLKAGG